MVELSKIEDGIEATGLLDGAVGEAGPTGNGRGAHEDPSATYTGANIRVLEGIEAIRLRPAMYIGGTDVPRAASPGQRGRGQLDR